MNLYTERSIALANQRNYLDQLFRVYPICPDSIREINQKLWTTIENAYNNHNNIELFKALLKLDLFPIKDGYVPYFRRDQTAIQRNPETVNRICGRVRELGLDKLWEKCTEPKETNRKMGPLFSRWIASGVLGTIPTVDEKTFINSNSGLQILDGTDKSLQEFAEKHLGYTRNKGLDLVAKKDNTYIIGEAKFITDEGGHQNAQFQDAISIFKTPTKGNVIKVAILDGVLYIPGKKKMYETITSNDLNAMSALMLRDFIYSL